MQVYQKFLNIVKTDSQQNIKERLQEMVIRFDISLDSCLFMGFAPQRTNKTIIFLGENVTTEIRNGIQLGIKIVKPNDS